MLPIVYLCYALLAVGVTIWLGRLISKNGAIFLRDVFAHDPEMAPAVNQLLLAGFYLVNFGYACLTLRGGSGATMQQAIEALAEKSGSLFLALAAMHFFNLWVFRKIRQNAREQGFAPRAMSRDEFPSVTAPHESPTA